MERIRVPLKGSLFSWIKQNYGSGFENYDHEHISCLLQGLEKLLSCCGSEELYFLGKLFLKLSDYPELQKKLKGELSKHGIR